MTSLVSLSAEIPGFINLQYPGFDLARVRR